MPVTKNYLGFTLVEVLIAVTIIAIGAAVAIPNLRSFNEDQVLTGTSNDIVSSIKQAQSNAQSGIRCPNSLASDSWGIKFSTTSNSSTYTLFCNGGGDPTNVNKPTTNIAEITINTNCADVTFNPPLEIKFSSVTQGEAKPIYPCSGLDVFTLKLKSIRTSQYDYVKVSKGGIIYESKIP